MSEALTKPSSSGTKSEVILKLEKIGKYFGVNKAVDDLSLEIKKGEIFTLLGPSGCGKTTTLRQIAGLEQPDEGKIFLRDRVLASPQEKINVSPDKRQMGMVFQSYAIWPHLSVFSTVAYPLKARKTPKAEIKKRVMNILEIVGLKGMESRPGPALSGGQQQRVALARALVYEPDILLLDEPFSNLDVKLREQMRVELKLLQRRMGVTVILVTHDQIEALSLSDRIAVMNHGRVEQIGSPQELYEQPKSAFVRDFIGKSITLDAVYENVERGTVIVRSGTDGADQAHRFTCSNSFVSNGKEGQQVALSIRPEDITVHNQSQGGENELEGTIATLLFIGDRYECDVTIGDQDILVYAPRNQDLSEGQKIYLHFPAEVTSIWPK